MSKQKSSDSPNYISYYSNIEKSMIVECYQYFHNDGFAELHSNSESANVKVTSLGFLSVSYSKQIN